VCRTVRDDGVYVLANGSVLEHLETYPNAMALSDYREVAAKPDALAAASVDGIDPNIESIRAERYAGSRAMYLYVNKERMYTVAGMLNFINWYVRSLESSIPSRSWWRPNAKRMPPNPQRSKILDCDCCY